MIISKWICAWGLHRLPPAARGGWWLVVCGVTKVGCLASWLAGWPGCLAARWFLEVSGLRQEGRVTVGICFLMWPTAQAKRSGDGNYLHSGRTSTVQPACWDIAMKQRTIIAIASRTYASTGEHNCYVGHWLHFRFAEGAGWLNWLTKTTIPFWTHFLNPFSTHKTKRKTCICCLHTGICLNWCWCDWREYSNIIRRKVQKCTHLPTTKRKSNYVPIGVHFEDLCRICADWMLWAISCAPNALLQTLSNSNGR